MTCNRDCFNCINRDCTFLEESQLKYNKTEKGKERMRRYNHSDKGKARAERYEKSEKGRENEKRKQQRRIASGKNAEACRRYYRKKKELVRE